MNTINKMISAYNHKKSNVSRIKYIVIHYVGALGGAKANCQYYGNGEHGVSAHYFVGFDGEIWQCVEDANIAWHCGGKSYVHSECRNSNSIGIEMCVRKRNTASLGATDRDWYFEDATVDSAIELTKYLMKKYNIPIDHVIRHYDVTGKVCPNPYVYNGGKHTWSQFKAALTAPSNLYRIRKSWEDDKSQIGAYSDLNNAKDACIDGYTVYDWNGNAVYTNNGTSEENTVWYRVRKSWDDTKGQVGAFKNLNHAKKRADEHPGHSVFDDAGNVLYTSKVTFLQRTVRVKIYDMVIRTSPTIDAPAVGFTGKGAFTIVAEKTGKIDSNGNVGTWGLLKSYEQNQDGWICLAYSKYTENV